MSAGFVISIFISMSFLFCWWLERCLGLCWKKEDSSLTKVMSVSSLTLVALLQDMIVVHWLPLNEVHILGWILSLLISDFKAWGLRSIPTPPMLALTVFSLWILRQIFIHYRYGILLSVCYGSIYIFVCIWCLYYAWLQMLLAHTWFIVFKVLMLNVVVLNTHSYK